MNVRVIRMSVVLGGAAAVYLLLGLTGFEPAAARAVAVVASAYGAMVQGSLGNPGQMIAAIASGNSQSMLVAFNPILESLVAATPYILSGLAVTVGLRGGVFNIGVEGQLFMGAIAATYIGYAVKGIPSALHITLALGGAALGGALWALIPAVLKAFATAKDKRADGSTGEIVLIIYGGNEHLWRI